MKRLGAGFDPRRIACLLKASAFISYNYRVMCKMKNALSILSLVFIAHISHAQAPNWEVIPSDYQYTMTVTAFLTVDGRTLTSEKDRVGAFVGNELRGSANVIYIEGVDRHLAYLTVYANGVGEEISFKIYDSSKGSVVPVERTLDFAIDEQYGSVLLAYSIAAPALNSEAVFYEFGFQDITQVFTNILEEQVEVILKPGQTLTELIPEFVVSDGGKVYVGDSLVSDTAKMDFTFPIVFTVVSEDESNFTTYQVSVENREMESFVSSNVITPNGDGSNDFWIVQDAYRYAAYTFRIFDANGRVLWESMGYNNDWDGYHNGKKLDRGKYYFVVENKEIDSVITGSILVLY